MIMFGSSLPSALGWLVTTKVYSGTGADIVMESITLKTRQIGLALTPLPLRAICPPDPLQFL
jgi:hypothetical protein